MTSEATAQQRRKPTAWVEDVWKRKDGSRKPRHGKGKRWRVWVVDLDGSRDGAAHFDRKVDAEGHRDSALARLRTGSYVSDRAGLVTVAEVWEQYLATQRDGATKARRESAWRTWVKPRWGTHAVRDVRRSAVRAWIPEMEGKGASAATVDSAMEVLRGILSLAVEDRKLAENPARGIKLPARTEKARAYLRHPQVWGLADEIDARYRTLVLFLAYTGLRFGEAAALTVADLDLLRRQVHVRQQVSEVEGKLSWTPTKGRKARRVNVPKFLVEPLSRECQGKGRDDAVFAAARGGTLRLNTWRTRIWNPAVEQMTDKEEGFPVITPHDLRHTAASLAVSGGANVKALQRMLGHESAALTLDTYSDLFPEDLESVAAALDAAVEKMAVEAAP